MVEVEYENIFIQTVDTDLKGWFPCSVDNIMDCGCADVLVCYEFSYQ